MVGTQLARAFQYGRRDRRSLEAVTTGAARAVDMPATAPIDGIVYKIIKADPTVTRV